MQQRPEAQAIICRDNTILIALKGEHWRLPKGGAEAGESLMQTLRRELNEETGLENYVSAKEIHKYTFETPGIFHLVTVFVVDIGDTAIAPDGVELTELRWVSIKESLAMLSFEEERECVRQYMLKK